MSIDNVSSFITRAVRDKLINASKNPSKEHTRIDQLLRNRKNAAALRRSHQAKALGKKAIHTLKNNTAQQEAVRVNSTLVKKRRFLSEYCAQYEELKGSRATNYISQYCILGGALAFGLILFSCIKLGFSPAMILCLIFSGALLLSGVTVVIVEARKIRKYAQEAYQEYSNSLSRNNPLPRREILEENSNQSETTPTPQSTMEGRLRLAETGQREG